MILRNFQGVGAQEEKTLEILGAVGSDVRPLGTENACG